MSSALFQSIQLRELELKNRIMLSPMCQYAATDGRAGDWHLMHLGQYMVSGVGLVMIEMTNVQSRGRITPNCLGLFDDDCEAALKRVLDYCRQLSATPIAIPPITPTTKYKGQRSGAVAILPLIKSISSKP